MTMPKISVIIPLYNKEAIIGRSLQSVLSQDYDDFEIVIVNDGSTDRSMEIVRGIQDPRIVLIEQENGGPSKARNTGVKHAKGEWIVFLDADDELLPGALSLLNNIQRSHDDIELFCCEFYLNNGGNLTLPYEYSDSIVKDNYKSWFYNEIFPRTGATMYSKSLVLSYPFNERIRRYEDFECLFHIFNKARIFTLHTPILKMNAEFSNASSARTHIEEDFLGHLDFKNKSFWEYMCLYQFYLSERPHYKGQVEKLYPTLKYRYDLLLLYKFLRLFK